MQQSDLGQSLFTKSLSHSPSTKHAQMISAADFRNTPGIQPPFKASLPSCCSRLLAWQACSRYRTISSRHGSVFCRNLFRREALPFVCATTPTDLQRLHCFQIRFERHEVGLFAPLTRITSSDASGISYDVSFSVELAPGHTLDAIENCFITHRELTCATFGKGAKAGIRAAAIATVLC